MASIIGFGSPLVDILTKNTDEFIAKHELVKNGMSLVDADKSRLIYDEISDKTMVCGGSAMNCIQGIARQGVDTSFVGTVKDDELGKFIRDSLAKNGIDSLLINSSGNSDTGRVIGIISPDGERTFATHLGAASDFSKDDIKPELFEGQTYAFIEGYLIYSPGLIEEICKVGHAAGCKMAIDMAAFNVVNDFKDAFTSILKEHIDIVFANEEEANAISGKDEEGSLDLLAQWCDIAVVKIGKKGSLVKQGDKVDRIEIQPVQAIDTTGAGDLYASGFLSALFGGKDLATCVKAGSIVSREVVQVMGTTMSDETWDKINKEISDL